MTERSFRLAAIGAKGAGVANWPALREVLFNEAIYTPAEFAPCNAGLLSTAERRRVSDLTRLVLAAAAEACPAPPDNMQSVFVSQTGDGVTTHAICESLAAAQPGVSPTRFTNSVHNAAAAYWSIAMRRSAATTSICAGENGLSAGLLEAAPIIWQSGAPVLLVAYDAPYPFPSSERVSVRQPLALAFYLMPGDGERNWKLALSDTEAEALPAVLASHFEGHTCAPGLIWLGAANDQRSIALPYLPGLSVTLEPVHG